MRSSNDIGHESKVHLNLQMSCDSRARCLVLARLVVGALMLALLVTFVKAAPLRFNQLLSAAITYIDALEILGLSTQFFAFYSLVPEALMLTAFLGVGLILLRRRSNDPLTLLMALTITLSFVLFVPTLEVLLYTPGGWTIQILYAVSKTLTIIFFLVFPDGRFVPVWTRWLALGWGIFTFIMPLLSMPLFDPSLVLLLYGMGYFPGFVAQVYRYMFVSTPLQRQQTKWVVLGSILAVIAAGVGGVAGRTLLSTLFSASGVSALVFHLVGTLAFDYFPPLLLLLAITVSAMRYRLWDLDLLLNRSMVYGTVTTVLGALYLALVFLLTLLVRVVLNWGNETFVVFAATLAIALAFNPLRQRTQALIDRAFYRTRIDYREAVPTLSAQVATSIVMRKLATLLTEQLPQQLQISWATLAILNLEGDALNGVGADAAMASLPLEHPLAHYLQTHREPFTPAYAPPDLPIAVFEYLKVHEVALVIPLQVAKRLVGIYLLGPKLSGGGFSYREIELLGGLGKQAAVSVENARLYRQVEIYSRTLEQQVQARTQQLEQVNASLLEQNIKLDVILRNMADGLVVTDTAGLIALVNPAFTAMIGRPASALLRQPLAQVWPDALLAQTVAATLEVPGTVLSVDSHWGRQVYRASACTLGTGTDGRGGAVTVVRNITQEVQAARMKDDFVSMVSHELRTPMTSVLGFSRLIQKQFERNVQPLIPDDHARGQRAAQRINENINIIISEGERLTRLINDVLDIAKMEAGRIEWDMNGVTLDEIVESAVSAIRSLTYEKSIPVQLDLAADLPALYGDRDRLVQVITNLLSNALKFTDAGKVTVGARLLIAGETLPPFGARHSSVPTGLPAEHPLVIVWVQDTGTGISEHDLGMIFERFRQAGERTSGTRRSGTGLGLSICKEIVAHHGGYIWAESSMGQGSRFIFTLPLPEKT